MRLPTPVYESIPYLYFTACLLLVLLSGGNPVPIILAVALYIAGSSIWIMRSNARRRDRTEIRIFLSKLSRTSDHPYTPQWFYEEQPFLYMAAGVICLYFFDGIITNISGLLFVLSSLIVFNSRIKNRINRKHQVSNI